MTENEDPTLDASMLDETVADPDNDMSLARVVRTTQVDELSFNAGRILGIELVNFMCHKNLCIRFAADKYNCFYIVGPNGSGKSAIFAGLNIGLGGKGRSNDRGSSLTAYIKEGETNAKIRIHLANTGDNAHPDYGREIIVERMITYSGSRYALKSLEHHSERLVSTNKKDLDKILARFCIELENPLCWLSQDRARQFLHQMKPDKLYEIFMITSELIVVNNRYETTTTSLENLKMLVSNWKAQQKSKKENYEELRRILKAIEKLDETEKGYKQLKWWSLWVPVRDAKIKLREIQAECVKSEEKCKALQTKLDNRNAECEELEEEQKAKQAARVDVQSHMGQLTMQKKALIYRNRQIRDEVNTVERKVTAIKNDKRVIDSEIRHHENALKDLMGDVDRDIVGERAELQLRIDQHRHQEDSDNAQLTMLNARKQKVLAERDDAYQKVREAQADARGYDNDINGVKREKDEVARLAKDMMARFGKDTSEILRCLETNAKHFKRKPIGPIGKLVHIKDRRWVAPIEKVLKFELQSYICDNADDRRTFERMLSQYKLENNGVIVSKFSDQKINTSPRAPSSEVLTIERVLDVEDPTVFNYLLDACHMESIMLIESDEEAREVMQTNPPHNVVKAYTLQCSEVLPARHGKYYRFYTGNYTPRILNEVMPSPTIQSELDKRIEYLKAQKADAIKHAEALKAGTEKYAHSIKEVDEEISALQKRILSNEQQIKKIEEEKEQLESIVSRQVMIDNMRTALKENTKQRAEFQSKIDELESQKNALLFDIERNVAETDAKTAELKDVAVKLSVIDTEIVEVNKKVNDFAAQTAELQNRFQYLEKKLHKQLAFQQDAQDAVATAEEGLEARNTAEYLQPDDASDPPDMDKVPETEFLQRQIATSKRKLAEYRARINGVTVSKAEVERAKRDYLDASEMVEKQEKECAMFQESFEKREALFNQVKQNLPGQLQKKFKEFMSMRNYVGDLTVDHVNQRIEITVQTHKGAKPEDDESETESEPEEDVSMEGTPKKKSRRAATKKKKEKHEVIDNKGKDKAKSLVQDLKGLSGGERSYTTACFVMALWSCVECPFRCLDEFDVFMDMVNRRIVMELLSELARKHRHIQFFFFTPQGIQELDCGDVQVFTMNKVR